MVADKKGLPLLLNPKTHNKPNSYEILIEDKRKEDSRNKLITKKYHWEMRDRLEF